MAYPNSYFPAMYQPYQIQQQPSYPNGNAPQQNNLIWVSGEAGAKAYMVAPNQTVTLWDSEAQCIYLKSADASGMPSIKVLDYVIRDSAARPEAQPAEAYATKSELDALRAEITQLKNALDGGKEAK